MNQAQKRKKKSAALAVVLAAALALTGTFAWQSISQKALNEATGVTNPGGRLHDDFNGYNYLLDQGKTKDIYVENFTDPDDGGVPIYVRVKLDEYMEMGAKAGMPTGTEGKTATPLIVGASFDDKSTWQTYKPGTAGDAFREYWFWDNVSGNKWYMPTFNKNKDSLAADINGTLAGNDKDPAVGTPYDDYEFYASNENKTGNATYDADDNDVDEGDSATADNVTTVEETHKSKQIQSAKVITMSEWITMGRPTGNYWVYDTDGWAYWAEALNPGEATGLLLDGITLTREMDKEWYYGINVTGQFATAFDWGTPESGTGFYKDGETVSDDALLLLNQIAGVTYGVYVKDDKAERKVIAGEDTEFEVLTNREGYSLASDKVSWSVENSASPTSGTSINASGVLTVAADEPIGTKLMIYAKTKDGQHLARREMTVTTAAFAKINDIEPATTETVTIDGSDWYVMAKDGNKALIYATGNLSVGNMAFGETAVWRDSNIRAYLNGDYYNSLTELKPYIVETDITQRPDVGTDDSTLITTQDKIFIPSGLDFRWERYDRKEVAPVERTYNGEPLTVIYADRNAAVITAGTNGNYSWLRSVAFERDNKYFLEHTYRSDGHLSTTGTQVSHIGIRPMMWIQLP